MIMQYLEGIVRVGMAHLDDGAQFLIEEGTQEIIGTQGVQVDLQSAAPGEGHLAEGDEETAIGAVVIGQDQPLPRQFADGGEEAL